MPPAGCGAPPGDAALGSHRARLRARLPARSQGGSVMKLRPFALPLVALVVAVVLGAGMKAHAQIDPLRQSYGVYQQDALAGEIWREDLDTGRYTEHWVLYPR